jgi:hypothetical protein
MATLHAWKESFDRLHEDLLEIFGQRLRSLVAYQTHFGIEAGAAGDAAQGAADEHAHAMVLVDSLTYADLVACAAKISDWTKANVGTPLLLTREEFDRSLDAFPLELAAIASHHVLIAGADPFEGVHIDAGDVRRACETQAKSHLLHLREGFLEVRGEPAAVARLIAASAPPFRTLLLNLARLDGVHARSGETLVRHAAAMLGVPEALLEQVLAVRKPDDLDRSDALRVYAAYLDAVERIARFVDGWKIR